MSKTWHLLFIVGVLQLTVTPAYAAAIYKGFSKLDPARCISADKAVLSQLPSQWKEYGQFVKVCNLERNGKRSEISIISIFEQEYFLHVQESGDVPQLESFPLPIIVNNNYALMGTLPEVYPVDDITTQVVYYGKWQNCIPTEIRVDVENPAEGGDYHYEPIRYNSTIGRYEIRSKEIVNGRRR